MPGTNIVPIKLQQNGNKTVVNRGEVNQQTMKELGLTEADLEEFIRKNVEILFPDDEETLLIIGQQVRNQAAGRADLVAVDGDGNIVLIELKRDKEDTTARKEPFEFQAIRYAANYALIKTQQDIVQQLFAPYIERHKEDSEFQELANGLTASELATRRLDEFLQNNQAQGTLNHRQRIILIASSFDRQTLSACAWLASNGIDMRCMAVAPLQYDQQSFFKIEQIIPPPSLEDYFVNIESTSRGANSLSNKTTQSRRVLPRMEELLKWNLVAPGDRLYIKGYKSEVAEIVNHVYVKYKQQELKYNDWGKRITGWSAINIYECTIHEKKKETLDSLRREKLKELSPTSTAEPE